MWKKIVGGIVVLVVLVLVAVFAMTSGMTESAESFFKHMQAKQYEQARTYLSEDFRKSTHWKTLLAFMKQTGLDGYKSASWGNRSFEGKKGIIEGTIETLSGGAIPITVRFVKLDDGSWKIYAIDKPASGIQQYENKTKATAPTLPDTQQILTLVKESLHTFTEGLDAKDLSVFRNSTASAFQKEVSVKKLNNAFGSFMKMDVRFGSLNSLEPVLEPSPVLKNGILLIKGYYDTTPSRFYYTLKYIQEAGVWKIMAINVEIK